MQLIKLVSDRAHFVFEHAHLVFDHTKAELGRHRVFDRTKVELQEFHRRSFRMTLGRQLIKTKANLFKSRANLVKLAFNSQLIMMDSVNLVFRCTGGGGC